MDEVERLGIRMRWIAEGLGGVVGEPAMRVAAISGYCNCKTKSGRRYKINQAVG